MLASNNFFNDSDNKSFSNIFISILAISSLRTFFENFSNLSQAGQFFSFQNIFLHFPIYYISLFLSFALVIYHLTKRPLLQILNFESKVFVFILLAPLFDLLATKGIGASITYINTEPQNLVGAFFRLINPLGFRGVTLGVHIAAYAILLSLALFVYKSTRSFYKAFACILIGYSILYLYAVCPSFITLPEFLSNTKNSASTAYILTTDKSWIKVMLESADHLPYYLRGLNNATADTVWVTPITQLLFLLTFLQTIWLASIYYKNVLLTLKQEIRMERIFPWLAISTIGMTISKRLVGPLYIFNAVNLITLATFFLIIILNLWLAATINDIEDIGIDKISNPTRPLACGSVIIHQWRNIQIILLILIIFGFATLSSNVAFLLIIAQTSYYLYSAKPLRLKNNFITSSILTGLAAVAIMMAGFFLVSPNQRLDVFPVGLIFLIWISFGLIFNIKDLKDYAGDKENGMKTLPVVFGLRKSKIIMALICCIIFIAIPLIFNLPLAIPFSIIAAVFMSYLITKKTYVDKHAFLLIALYIVSILIFFQN